MKILLVVEETFFFHPKFVEELCKQLKDNIVGTLLITKIPKKNSLAHYLVKNLRRLYLSEIIILPSIFMVKKIKDLIYVKFKIGRPQSVRSVLNKYNIQSINVKNFFDDEILNLMDFDCDQKNSVHFFYTLPFSKTKALIETTWISDLNNNSLKDYDKQLKNYIENKLKIKNYKINFKETGAIPLFYPTNIKKFNQMEIGIAGKMTRLSTGYTFLNIQEQSKYIRDNIENITKTKIFSINKKYQFLDNIFLKVLKNNPDRMAQIFYKIFNGSPNTAINFLSNKSNILEDISIISKMPKWVFLKQLF